MDRLTLELDGRTVGWYDSGTGGDDALAVIWHHGTPNIGEPPEPLFSLADELGVRLLGVDRPGYGASEGVVGRSVADIAPLAAAVADEVGAERFAVMGHSGGGPHALACAALLPSRVVAAVTFAGVAPLVAPGDGPAGLGMSWWDGMHSVGTAELKAALQGGEALEELLASEEWDPSTFTDRDLEALDGRWSWFTRIAALGVEHGRAGFVADDLAFVRPWGFSVTDVTAPTRIVQGGDDRIVPVRHGRWLGEGVPEADYQERPGDGHLTVVDAAFDALRWVSGLR
ncbi:alpha/beta fold hydrolase [Demequina salsinemoris]|uniref:alpha/beta fold hydrolase n=1 Tax=Demequina salsinemoris TaxID=577470 RepID=UPI0007838041|nr:alpha/beta hydrolase [Demequina salsinemoris]